jgi:hypothetical protein
MRLRVSHDQLIVSIDSFDQLKKSIGLTASIAAIIGA